MCLHAEQSGGPHLYHHSNHGPQHEHAPWSLLSSPPSSSPPVPHVTAHSLRTHVPSEVQRPWPHPQPSSDLPHHPAPATIRPSSSSPFILKYHWTITIITLHPQPLDHHHYHSSSTIIEPPPLSSTFILNHRAIIITVHSSSTIGPSSSTFILNH